MNIESSVTRILVANIKGTIFRNFYRFHGIEDYSAIQVINDTASGIIS